MSTKYFIDKDGRYIGAFSCALMTIKVENEEGDIADEQVEVWPELPPGGIEVSRPPNDARQLWQGGRWIDTPEMEVAAAREHLAATDAKMARVGEDVIAVLINKGLLSFDDIPPTARALLMEREEARGNL